MRPQVIIIGHGSTSRLGIVRSVAALEADITLIAIVQPRRFLRKLDQSRIFDCYSKYVSHCYYLWGNDGEGLRKILFDHCLCSGQKAVLIPDCDFAVSWVDSNMELLSDHFVFPHIYHTAGLVNYWMDKSVQKVLARDVGLNVAQSVTVDVSVQPATISNKVNYPVFTKALLSLNGGKQLFRRCDTIQQLQDQIDKARNIGVGKLLVEQYLDIEKEYAVVGFSDGQRVVIPGVIEFLQYSQSHFGVALKGCIRPVDGMEDLMERFSNFVLRMGFVGVFDIDFFYATGKYWFGEMNLRFGGSGYAATCMGVNLPAMLVRHLLGMQTEKVPERILSTATFVNERMALDDWYRNCITTSDYHQLTQSTDISFVNDPADLRPQRIFNRVWHQFRMRRFIRNVIRHK